MLLRHPDFSKSKRDNVEVFVEKQQALGNDVWWDGWDLMFFRPDPRAVYNKEEGAYRNNTWGFQKRVNVEAGTGIWEVDNRDVRRST